MIELDPPALARLDGHGQRALGERVRALFAPAGRPGVVGLCAVPTRERRGREGRTVNDASREVRLDVGRRARIGLEEAVLCETKTAAQLAHILKQAADSGRTMLLTRLSEPQFQALRAEHAAALDYHALSQTGIIRSRRTDGRALPRIAIVTAGSSDARVAPRGGPDPGLRGASPANWCATWVSPDSGGYSSRWTGSRKWTWSSRLPAWMGRW